MIAEAKPRAIDAIALKRIAGLLRRQEAKLKEVHQEVTRLYMEAMNTLIEAEPEARHRESLKSAILDHSQDVVKLSHVGLGVRAEEYQVIAETLIGMADRSLQKEVRFGTRRTGVEVHHG